MVELQLDFDEGVLLQATEVERYGVREDSLDEMVLTNKNLICAYDFKASFFSKAEQRVDKIPLSMIKVVNGKVQLMRINHDDYGDVMQILYVDGKREFFSFFNNKKDIPTWINAINTAITGDETPIIEEPKKKGGLFSANKKEKVVSDSRRNTTEVVDEEIQVEKKKSNLGTGVGVFAAGLKNVMDSAKHSFDEASKQISNVGKAQQSSPTQPDPIEQPDEIEKNENVGQGAFFCSNCGERLNAGAKFCHICGAKVGHTVQVDIPPVSSPTNTQRQQEYVGKVYKCPNCGSVITQTTAVCPDCGMRLSGVSALSSVRDFNQQLMAIEAGRKKSKFMDLYTQSANPADTQKLTLIRNYPIPNTVEDVREFVLLAIANIDTKLSKNTAAGKMASMMNSGNVNLTMQKTISDAWVAKLQQVYLKAEATFPFDPAFEQIKRMYYDKMSELKIKI